MTAERWRAVQAAASTGDEALWGVVDGLKAEAGIINQQWDDAAEADRPG